MAAADLPEPTATRYAHPTRTIDDLSRGDRVVVVYGGRAGIWEFVRRGPFRWATKKFGRDYIQVRMGTPRRTVVVPTDRAAAAKTTEELEREHGRFEGVIERGGA